MSGAMPKPPLPPSWDATNSDAHRLACEARDWIRRGIVPGAPTWPATLKLITDKRGAPSARRLEDAITAWYASKDAWLPELERKLAPYSSSNSLSNAPFASDAAASEFALPSPSTSRLGSFLSRVRHSPA